jgi:hypothetical protein
MVPALPFLLTEENLPPSELAAARLDGDLCAVAGSYCPADVRLSAALRGEAIAPLVPSGLIVERLSAAWLHGATPGFPRPVQLCIRSAQRVRVQPSIERRVRQVVLGENEIVPAGPVRATDAFRTAVDLLRWEPLFDRRLALCVTTLLLIARASPERCRSGLRLAPHLPHKQRALRRLAELPTALRSFPV